MCSNTLNETAEYGNKKKYNVWVNEDKVNCTLVQV